MFFMKRIVYINSTTLHLNDDKYIIFSSIVSLGHKFELGLSEIGCTEYIFGGRGGNKKCLNEIYLWRHKFTWTGKVYFTLIPGLCFL